VQSFFFYTGYLLVALTEEKRQRRKEQQQQQLAVLQQANQGIRPAGPQGAGTQMPNVAAAGASVSSGIGSLSPSMNQLGATGQQQQQMLNQGQQVSAQGATAGVRMPQQFMRPTGPNQNAMAMSGMGMNQNQQSLNASGTNNFGNNVAASNMQNQQQISGMQQQQQQQQFSDMMKNRLPTPNATAPTPFNANQQQQQFNRDNMGQQLNAQQQQQQIQHNLMSNQQQQQPAQLPVNQQQQMKQVPKAPIRSVSMSSQHQAIAAALNAASEPETPYNNIGKGGAGMGKGGGGMGKGKHQDDGPSGKDLKCDIKSEHDIKPDPDGESIKMEDSESMDDAGSSMIKREIKEEPMSTDSDIKPPIPEPIPQPAGSSDKKKKCSKY